MKSPAIALALAAMFAATAALPSIANAANARHPYKNVNHANDRGNRTGDAATDRLNQQQLDQVRTGR